MSDEPDGPKPDGDEAPTSSGVRAYSNPATAHSGVRAYSQAAAVPDPSDAGGPSAQVRAPSEIRLEASEILAVPVIDATSARSPAPSVRGPSADEPTSSDLARRAQKQRRRERDRKAERTAMLAILGIAGVLGVIGWFVLQSLDEQDAKEWANRPDAGPAARPAKPLVVTTRSSDSDVDIKAITQMKEEGLTIAAEGLPRIIVESGEGQPAAVAASVMSCRFAYGIWEFSPNSMFKFVPTCVQLRGEELVGAYEIRGSEVWLSALTMAEGTVVETVFKVEKPSSLVSTARLGTKVQFRIEQRVTVMRPGMNAEAFKKSLSEKNTFGIEDGVKASVPKPRAEPEPAPAPEKSEKPKSEDRDPVLDLLDE